MDLLVVSVWGFVEGLISCQLLLYIFGDCLWDLLVVYVYIMLYVILNLNYIFFE